MAKYSSYIDLQGMSFLATHAPEEYAETITSFRDIISMLADGCRKANKKIKFYVFSDSCFIESDSLADLTKVMQRVRFYLLYSSHSNTPFRAGLCKGCLGENEAFVESKSAPLYSLIFAGDTCVKLVSLESGFKGIGVNVETELQKEAYFVESIYFDEQNKVHPYFDLAAQNGMVFAKQKILSDFQIEYVQEIMEKAFKTKLYSSNLDSRYISSIVTIIQSANKDKNKDKLARFQCDLRLLFFNAKNFEFFWQLNGIEYIYAILLNEYIYHEEFTKMENALTKHQRELILKSLHTIPLRYFDYSKRMEIFKKWNETNFEKVGANKVVLQKK